MTPPPATVNRPSSASFHPDISLFLNELNIGTTAPTQKQSPNKNKKKVTFNLDASAPHAHHQRPPATHRGATTDKLKLNSKRHPSAGIKKKRRNRAVGAGSGIASPGVSASLAATHRQFQSPGSGAQVMQKKKKGKKGKPISNSINSMSLDDSDANSGDGTRTGTGTGTGTGTISGGHSNKNDSAPGTPDGPSNAQTAGREVWMGTTKRTNDPTEQEYASQIRAIFEQRRAVGRKKLEEEERRLVGEMYARKDALLKHIDNDIIEPARRNMDKLFSNLNQRLGAQVKTIKEVDAWLKQEEQNDEKRAKGKDIKQQLVKGYQQITSVGVQKITHIRRGMDSRCRQIELDRHNKQSMNDYLGDILPKFVNMLRETPSKASAAETADAAETANEKAKATTTKKGSVKGKVKKKTGRGSKSHDA